jgi:hypothetical protein
VLSSVWIGCYNNCNKRCCLSRHRRSRYDGLCGFRGSEPVPERITTKDEMYRRMQAGEFGNRPRMWNSLAELYASGYQGLVSLRCRRISDPYRRYHVPLAEIESLLRAERPDKIDAGLVFSEAPDDTQRTIQGELQELPGGLALTYSLVRAPMRDAFDVDRRHAQGLTAKLLLSHYLYPPDLEHLYQLLERWPDHVIEFSAFRIPIGVEPGSRMFVWEVRAYIWLLLPWLASQALLIG